MTTKQTDNKIEKNTEKMEKIEKNTEKIEPPDFRKVLALNIHNTTNEQGELKPYLIVELGDEHHGKIPTEDDFRTIAHVLTQNKMVDKFNVLLLPWYIKMKEISPEGKITPIVKPEKPDNKDKKKPVGPPERVVPT